MVSSRKPSAARVARLYLRAQGRAFVVSPDHYLIDEETGEYVWSPELATQAWDQSYEKLRQLMTDPKIKTVVLMVGIPASGKSTWLQKNAQPDTVYYDATFTIREHRAPVIDIAKKGGKRIEAVVMDTPLPVCLGRNECRSPDRKVPHDVVERMHTQLLHDPPMEDEGFDQINRIESETPATPPDQLGNFDRFVKELFGSKGLQTLIPNRNPKTRERYPKVQARTLLKTDPEFRRLIRERFQQWREGKRRGWSKESSAHNSG